MAPDEGMSLLKHWIMGLTLSYPTRDANLTVQVLPVLNAKGARQLAWTSAMERRPWALLESTSIKAFSTQVVIAHSRSVYLFITLHSSSPSIRNIESQKSTGLIWSSIMFATTVPGQRLLGLSHRNSWSSQPTVHSLLEMSARSITSL